MKQFDLVIVGGGMVGASLALLLQPMLEKGLRVALVDAQAIETDALLQPSFDARTSALSLGTQRTFESLDLWGELQSYCNPIEHIRVSQKGQWGRVHLDADECGVSAMGQVVENRHLGQTLWKRVQQNAQLTVFAPASLTQINMVPGGAQLALETPDGELQLDTALLVLADGANSTGCRLLGIDQRRHNYQQHALVLNIAFDLPHNNHAYERFTLDGPLALLPLTENRFGVVWCQSPEQAERRMALNDQAFKTELQNIIGLEQGRISKLGARQAYPLSLVVAQEQVRPNVVVLGNAAHALHPVAGQGFNLALRDTLALSHQIERDWEQGKLGQLSGLMEYQQALVKDQRLTMGASHALPTTYMQSGAQWSLLRAGGMTLMDNLPLAKRLFARQAMGLTGAKPPWQKNSLSSTAWEDKRNS